MTVFFFLLSFFSLLVCKYVFWIYITVFVLKLINLFNAYILFLPDFVLLTGNKSRGCCLSNVKQNVHQHFYNSCYSLHLCFAVSALGDDFATNEKQRKKKWYSFHCIYLYVTYYVLLCRTWSDVSWSLLVKWFSFTEFPNHDKRRKKQSQSHNLPFCLYATCCHLHIAPREFKRGRSLKMLGVKAKIKKPGNWWPLSGLEAVNLVLFFCIFKVRC